MIKRIVNIYKHLSLAQAFMLTSLVVIIAAMVGLGAWVSGQIKIGVINRSGATTALYVDSFVAPLLQDIGKAGTISAQNMATLTKLLQETSFGQQIVAFKAWDLNGRVIYSTDPAIVGKTFPMHESFIKASQGNVSTRVSNESDENASQRAINPELLEIYSPVRLSGTNQIIAVAEYYQSMDILKNDINSAQQRSWLVVGIVMVLIYLVLSGFIQKTSNTIEQQQMELNRQIEQLSHLLSQNKVLNNRVRKAAASISTIHERLLRRIGAELHDGPSQELGLALLQLDTSLSRMEKFSDVNFEKSTKEISQIQQMLQNTLIEMRGIAAGLSLPQLVELNLGETIVRVVRSHERMTDSKVNLIMESIPQNTSLPVKITVYRVLQEAMNNAYHHANGAAVDVTVTSDKENLSIEVYDRGGGFKVDELSDLDGHMGLIGMRERVESLGGNFLIESTLDTGTRISAQIPLVGERE